MGDEIKGTTEGESSNASFGKGNQQQSFTMQASDTQQLFYLLLRVESKLDLSLSEFNMRMRNVESDVASMKGSQEESKRQRDELKDHTIRIENEMGKFQEQLTGVCDEVAALTKKEVVPWELKDKIVVGVFVLIMLLSGLTVLWDRVAVWLSSW